MKQYVILGNGVAAVGCIEGIRREDKESAITVVSKEPYAVYGRPLISYYLEGKTDLERMKYRPDDFYEKNGCTVLYGKTAVKLDKENQQVLLDDGTSLPYDELCVATGSSPFVPPFEGLDTVKNQYPFMTLDDTLALEKAVTPSSRVLIIGAGLIGLKCAEGLAERVGEITVCDLAGHVLSSILDETCAGMVAETLEAHGIHLMLGDSVARFDGQTALMKSGRTVEFDVLVLAVGVRANTSLVKDAGGETERGILVNKKMETTLPHVYAAGDCTQGDELLSGQKRVLALLPNAYMQGQCAGINMAGGESVFDKAIAMNSIGFFGLHLMTAGCCFPKEEGGEVYEEHIPGGIKRLFTKDGFLTGFMLINATDRAGIYTAMIREQIPLDTVNFELLQKTASLCAFSAENRRKKLGGVV